MALRVLLADESSTIKKVMQLALSDFGVEVKSVPVGVDVLSVAKSFKPDIVFADILLTKKNGYEVCQDLKRDSATKAIPVVLMWSGFLEIDEAKAQDCQAEDRLEKPFDADILRGMVRNLVQKTKTSPISNYLTFPDMPEFEEALPETSSEAEFPVQNFSQNLTSDDVFALPEIDENDQVTSPGYQNHIPTIPDETDEGGWAHQDLTKFKLQIPDDVPDDFATKFVIPQDDDLSHPQVEVEGDFEEISFEKTTMGRSLSETVTARVEKSVKDQMMQTLQKGTGKTASPKATPNAEPNTQSKIDLNSNMMEKVIREEAREVIETICWKLLPEITERIVREELNKILKEVEKSI